jgi:hypothetical protein
MARGPRGRGRAREIAVLLSAVPIGCGEPEGAEAGPGTTGLDSSPNVTTGSESTTALGDASTTLDTADGDTAAPGVDSGSTTSGPPEDPPIVFDLGIQPDAPVLDPLGCGGIDFLFVVDNSGSMTVQQAQLLNSFNGFIGAIQNSIEQTSSYHVGVITSDNYIGNATGCQTIGDLVTQTAGSQSSNSVCEPFAEGGRFATEQDNLPVKFPCMAQVGTTGSPIEQPVTATIAALDPAKAEPGGCNEGFLREDAILVVVIVTDDPVIPFDVDDAHPNTDTSGWHDAVLAAKAGDPEAVVVIGFVPWTNISCTGSESPNLIGFVESFGEQGVLASVCEPDYGPIFAEAISTIETTCAEFDPPR